MTHASVQTRILDALRADGDVSRAVALLATPGNTVVVSGARGGSAPAVLAAALAASERPALVVTTDGDRARSVAQDLRYLLDTEDVSVFPGVDVPLYSPGIAGMSVRAARIETLFDLLAGRTRAVVTTVEAAALRVPTPAHIKQHVLDLRVGETRAFDDVLIALDELGYQHSVMVEEHGEYSRRGGILDFYSFGREHPVRVEFDGDDIVSLREFDAATQRSVSTLEAVTVLPTQELRLTVAELEAARGAIAAAHPGGEAGADKLIDDLVSRRDVEGAYWLQGLFPDRLTSIVDFLPKNGLVVVDGPGALLSGMTSLAEDAASAHADAIAAGRFFALPEQNFLLDDAFRDALRARDQLVFPGVGDPKDRALGRSAATAIPIQTLPAEGFGRNLNVLRDEIARLHERGHRALILCESAPHQARLVEMLDDVDADIEVGSLGEGFALPSAGLRIIVDHEIWGRPRRQRGRARRFKRGILPSELSTLKVGDYVVHVEHGIGQYQGMERLDLGGQHTDCLLVTYSKGDKLYIPADQLDLVQRYSAGDGAVPAVSTIGGTGWQKLKSRVKRRIKIMAEELIQTYAKRRALPGTAFSPDTVWQREMEASFPYDETVDQMKAIEDVKKDMEAPRPMDRLVCGDVGFGKTEVAIRAAFKSVQDGKQVAILVPTTLLAEQHLKTFSDRLAPYPVRIDMLSRFRSKAGQKKTCDGIAAGTVDICIGTHRLLSKDVNFKNLGLLVIDEEQRFGVRHKEVLKKLRSQVDVLTLTATPIPRTLHLSLMGARDMSIINTPPKDRQPIHTEIVEFSDELIAEALLHEADRGGQSFFVHNRVETIDAMGAYLQKHVPELRIAIAHGQLAERQIERTMLAFYNQEYDVLLTTMIIESGLDIPTVNTILINRADAFGLAQLYQLRGRVGRSPRKAHAYLLVPRDRAITEIAQKRLRVIDELEELGSGFVLAMRDLEIRGAGNMLGAEQSGFILNVGFDMYCRLLDEAVSELKGLPIESVELAKLSTDLDAYLPEEYVPNRSEKVRLYKRLADADGLDTVDAIQEELVDRFGPLPEVSRTLVDLRRIRLLATRMGATSIIVRKGLFEVVFADEMSREDVRALLRATQAPVEFRATGEQGFRIGRLPDPIAAEALRLLTTIASARGAAAVTTS